MTVVVLFSVSLAASITFANRLVRCICTRGKVDMRPPIGAFKCMHLQGTHQRHEGQERRRRRHTCLRMSARRRISAFITITAVLQADQPIAFSGWLWVRRARLQHAHAVGRDHGCCSKAAQEAARSGTGAAACCFSRALQGRRRQRRRQLPPPHLRQLPPPQLRHKCHSSPQQELRNRLPMVACLQPPSSRRWQE